MKAEKPLFPKKEAKNFQMLKERVKEINDWKEIALKRVDDCNEKDKKLSEIQRYLDDATAALKEYSRQLDEKDKEIEKCMAAGIETTQQNAEYYCEILRLEKKIASFKKENEKPKEGKP